MGNICNPTSMRLGHHTFWVSQSNFTLGNHCRLITRYKNQNYIYTMQYLMQWFFAEKYREVFYMKLFTIYKCIQINFIGFFPRYSYIHIQIFLFDFNLHVTKYLNQNWRSLKYAMLHRLKETTTLVRYKNKNLFDIENYKLFTKFLAKFLETFHLVKKTVKQYFKKFMFFVKKFVLFTRINRIQKFYYPNIPYRLFYKLIPVSAALDAHYVATYIERRLRTGGYIKRILSQVSSFLIRSKLVLGYKLCCSGRFKRGARKGYVWRVKGQYSYGSFSNNFHMQYAATSTILRTGVCGIKVWMVVNSFNIKKTKKK